MPDVQNIGRVSELRTDGLLFSNYADMSHIVQRFEKIYIIPATACTARLSVDGTMTRNMCKTFSLIPSKTPVTREN